MKTENFITICMLLLSLFFGYSGQSINSIELKNKCHPERASEEIVIPFSHSFKQFDYNCKHEYGYDSFYARYKDNENRILETKLSFREKGRNPIKNENIYSWLSFENMLGRNKNTYLIKKKITFEPNQTLTSIFAADRIDIDSIIIVSTTAQMRKDGSLVACELTHTFKKEDDFERKIIELGNIYSGLKIK